MKLIGIISIIIIMSLMISLSDALTVKSEKNKEEINPKILGSAVTSGTKAAPPTVAVSEGIGGRETIHYESSPGDLVQIQKIVLPGNKKKYTKDDMLKICIEIKSNAEINGLKIHEFVSDGYSIVNISSCYKISNLRDLDRYRDSLYESSSQFSGEVDDIVINKHGGSVSIPWDCLCGNNSTQNDTRKKFLECILGKKLDNVSLLSNNINSAIFEICGSNCSIEAFKGNNTACLKYGKLIYELYLYQEKIKNIELDEYTGRIIDKIYQGDVSINNSDNNFDIYVPSLTPKERLVYSYYIKPKNQFSISTITTIRIYDSNYQNYPDIDYPLDIEIFSPEYDVSASFNKYNLLDTEKLKVKYSIYGEDFIENGVLPLEIKLDDSLGNFIIYDPINDDQEVPNSVQTINISSNMGANITYLIKFKEAGSYSLPAIKINDKPHPFEREITVETKAQRYSDLIPVLFGFLFIIIGEIFGGDISGYFNARAKGRSIVPLLALFIILLLFLFLLWLYWPI